MLKAGKADSTKCTRRDANNTKGTQKVQTGTQKSTTDRANTKNGYAKSYKGYAKEYKGYAKRYKGYAKEYNRASAIRKSANNIGPRDPDISRYAL